jgi:hypothetical protein
MSITPANGLVIVFSLCRSHRQPAEIIVIQRVRTHHLMRVKSGAASYLQQFDPDVTDAIQQPVQGGLVRDLRPDRRRVAFDVDLAVSELGADRPAG